ncbi:RNA 2'-phosphotransferase [Paenibacillus rigui]|uniref:Probable RNA 2'-phosphotransferase n=1 Tax=Paenibacillus rigui TaxID=554312 RepID=A0A229UKS5_9BACL|nr:RNA 2'-phosphotransferase [Paenibacillus rigui]OXM83509.1 RNA 2'-phosphotransferase [Paenibacillus rigui]
MLTKNQEISLSKFMTKLLRHTPEAFGLRLDPEDGTCRVEELLQVLRSEPRWRAVTLADVEQVVRHCEKQRFDLTDGSIRARYGHSRAKVSYPVQVPPKVLYHGTNAQAAPLIEKEGLRPMGRQYVHMSEGLHFATLAGQRRGELVMLLIDTEAARQQGVVFYNAGHEVWLADAVPAACTSKYPNEESGAGQNE